MNPLSSPLLTDLYQLTMLQGYYDQDMNDTAVFEFFVRELPPQRGFLVAAGLEQVLDHLEALRLSGEEVQWLRDSGRFSAPFIEWLAEIRFTGDVHAMPEGTPFYENEPILRVTAPLPQAQLIESRLINILHYQSLIASKAARCVLTAPDKNLVDFGLRRSHGAEAGLFAARASYIAGFAGTSTVLADPLYGIPIFGTMAHSFVQAHEDESAAFDGFARSLKDNVVLLIDTYDTEAAAHKVVELAPRLEREGIRIKAVRLDSGDMIAHSRRVRGILDGAGQTDIAIFSSGNIDENALREVRDTQAPIDGFGVGTRLDTSADVPYLDCAYKLQEYAGTARRKRSEGKATWPGRKQVYRRYDRDGRMQGDLLTLEDDIQDGDPLIRQYMDAGHRTGPREPLETIRERTAGEYRRLPEALARLEHGPAYPVTVSERLQALAEEVDARMSR